MAWSDEAEKDLKALILGGESAGKAAKALSLKYGRISRNAVIGKASRLGIQLANPIRAQELRTAEVRRRVAVPVLPSDPPPASLPASLTDPVRQAKVDAIALAPKTILQDGFGGCRWPLYRTAPDGQTLHCCNAREVAPYCPGHARLAFTKSQPTAEQAADAALTKANQRANAGKAANALSFRTRAA